MRSTKAKLVYNENQDQPLISEESPALRANPEPGEQTIATRQKELPYQSDAYVLELACQLRARACNLDCSRELHDWSFVVLNEALRRLRAFRTALERIERMPWAESESPYARIAREALQAGF